MTRGRFLHLVIMIKNVIVVALISMNVGAKILKNKNSEIMKVYISGKIGEEVLCEATRQKFAQAEKTLQARGLKTFNPTTSGLGRHAESIAKIEETTFWEEIIILDLMQMKNCDAIYLLPDWQDSPGALTEFNYAKGAKKKIFFASWKQATLYLSELWNAIPREKMPLSEASELQKKYITEHIDEIWIPMNYTSE